MPTGTLMKKIHSQPNPSVSGPPTSDAAVPPRPPTAPQTARALFRSASRVKVVSTSESAAGAMIAADRPWTARAAISTAGVHARPQASDDTTKTADPTMNSLRRPRRSAARPQSSSRPPNTKA
jgi:hypothetical protein